MPVASPQKLFYREKERFIEKRKTEKNKEKWECGQQEGGLVRIELKNGGKEKSAPLISWQ